MMSKSIATSVRIGALSLVAVCLVCGCAPEEAGELGVVGFTDATPSDLTYKEFRFGPDAGVFPQEDPRFGLSATLIVGELGSNGPSAGFALSADDGSLQGGVLQLRPCDFITTFLQPAGEEPQIDSFVSQDFFEWCGVDSEGRLGLQEDDETLPVISEPATEPTVELDAMVSLSPGLVVDPPFPLDQRVETGTVELKVFGNVLSYTVTIENLSATDEVRDGQIRRGGASENGDVLVTLFGEPIQTVRSWGPPSLEGSSLTASVFITPDEAAALTDSATPLYILFTSQQISSGLMRGQLREAP
jgi:hypothetical protein